MFVRLISLISILLLCANAYSNEIGLNVSGFVYNTTFSDNRFHDNRTIAAVNVDADYEKFAIRTQLASTENALRRAVFEYSLPVHEKTEVIYQAGRFNRIDSFSNNALDAPASSQMAILPLAGYSYRMINGDFALMDGQQLIVSNRTNWGHLVWLRAAYGYGVIDYQENLQKEAFRRYDPNLEIRSKSNNFDAAFHYETANTNWYIARNQYSFSVNSLSDNFIYRMISAKLHNGEYCLNRYGFKYDDHSWIFRTELTQGFVTFASDQGVVEARNKAEDVNYVVGKYIGPTIVYIGHSRGENKTASTANVDTFIGVTYNYKSFFTTSLEYHDGDGRSWMKYSTDSQNGKWNAFVISTTFRF